MLGRVETRLVSRRAGTRLVWRRVKTRPVFQHAALTATLVLAVTGCATVGSGRVDSAEVAAKSAATAERAAASILPVDPAVIASVSIAAAPAFADEIASRYVGAEVSRRVYHVVASVDGDGGTALVHGKFGRTTLGAGLRKSGYTRVGRGEWRADWNGTSVRFVERGIALIEVGEPDPRDDRFDYAVPPWACDREIHGGALVARVWTDGASYPAQRLLNWHALYLEVSSPPAPGSNDRFRGDLWLEFAGETGARAALVIGRISLLHLQELLEWSDADRKAIAVERCGSVVLFSGLTIPQTQALEFVEVFVERLSR